MPLGLFSFTIADINPGDSAILTMHFPEGVLHNSFFKFGPTNQLPTDHWYEFTFDPLTATGAVAVDVDGDGDTERIELHLTDGGPGDADRAVNGRIVDPSNVSNVTSFNGEIYGVKFHDVNGNGKVDTGEARLAGWTIFLDQIDSQGDASPDAVLNHVDPAKSNTCDPEDPPLEPCVVTDSNGLYSFTDLRRQDYRVAEVPQLGWYPSSPAPFRPQPQFDAPYSVGFLQSADLDDDDAPDLVALTEVNGVLGGGHGVQVFLNAGNGTFQPGEVRDPDLNLHQGLAIADFDLQFGNDKRFGKVSPWR